MRNERLDFLAGIITGGLAVMEKDYTVGDIGKLIESLGLKIEGIISRVEDIESRVEDIESQVGNLKLRIGNLGSQVDGLNRRVSAIRSFPVAPERSGKFQYVTEIRYFNNPVRRRIGHYG